MGRTMKDQPKRRSSVPKDKSTTRKMLPKMESAKPDLREIVSRKEITAVTMNMSGRSGLGITPKYKIDMVQDYLSTSMADIILVQDCIEISDITSTIEKVGGGTYDWYFNPDKAQSGEKSDSPEEEDLRCVTGLVWNKDKYLGTPLQMDDKRLNEYSKWLKRRSIAIVKLDSAQRANKGKDDVYPSLVAISWHGPDYDIALKQRTQVLEEFFAFLAMLRKNNWHIPLLVGGDFNMDMKSFDFEKHSEFLCVPYRPISGSLAKDLKNTFLFSVDSLQVTETMFKQFHPEIYPSPFITVRVRGRTKMKLWAVIKIQRCLRAYLKRVREKRKGKKELKDSKKRWKRKIEGDDYVSEPDSEPEEAKYSLSSMNSLRIGSNGEIEGSAIMTNDLYSQPLSIPLANHRRKKHEDLKSVHEKKQEMSRNEPLMRSLRPRKGERYEF